jgi:predicted nucleotidyltransferase
VCVGFVSRHLERDLSLPKQRDAILEKALADLTLDSNVLAIYLGGSLAKGKADLYSDIDLHTLVASEKKRDFIINKRTRAAAWGEVLFYEDFNPLSPVVVTHYDCFVKVDSWYHSPEEMVPSIWLKGLKVLYDPSNIIRKVIQESSNLDYQTSAEEVEFWRGKVLAFIHETYRAVMRHELYYAVSNLDRVRWLIASGWYMEENQRLDSAYGVWSKVEGGHSALKNWQLSLLDAWEVSRNANEIIKTMMGMATECFRLNKCLSKLTGIEEKEELFKKAIEMAY